MTSPALLNKRNQGIFLGLFSGALWGLVFLSPKVIDAFSPLSQMVIRYLFYGFFAIALSIPRIFQLIKDLNADDWKRLIVLSLQGNIIYYLGLSIGVKYAGIAPTSLIIGILPLSLAFISRNEHDSISFRQLLLPCLLIVLGILSTSLNVFLQDTTELKSSVMQRVFGLCAAIASLLCWTLFAFKNAQYLRTHTNIKASDWSNLTGVVTAILAIVMLFIGLIISRFDPNSLLAITTDPSLDWLTFILLGGIGVAFFASWLGNICWNQASQSLPISLSAQLLVSESLFSLLYAFIYETRMPNGLEWLAMVLLLAGVLWAIRLHTPKN